MPERAATEDSRAEEALEAFYVALADDDAGELYDRAPCGYLSTAPDGTIIKVNQTFLTWTGYSRDELVGRRRFPELLTPGGRIYHETHYAPMLQMQGIAREIALDIVGADGRRLPALVNSVLERDAAGNPGVVRAAVFDATERREYERELLRAKQRAEESERRARELVKTLQQTLIPPAPPKVDGLDVSSAYRAAGTGDEVGGDFYDIFEVGPGHWVVAVGDVRGKGVEAAVVTALARYSIRAAAVRHPSPAEALRMVNRDLVRQGTDRFCTVVLVSLSRRDAGWRATLACAGHPQPLFAPASGGPRAVGYPGMLLGVLPETSLEDDEIELKAGDMLVLYTDGVTEARREDDFFGEEGLEAAVARGAASAQAMTGRLLDEVLGFQAGFPRDDIVVVTLRVPG